MNTHLMFPTDTHSDYNGFAWIHCSVFEPLPGKCVQFSRLASEPKVVWLLVGIVHVHKLYDYHTIALSGRNGVSITTLLLQEVQGFLAFKLCSLEVVWIDAKVINETVVPWVLANVEVNCWGGRGAKQTQPLLLMHSHVLCMFIGDVFFVCVLLPKQHLLGVGGIYSFISPCLPFIWGVWYVSALRDR